MTLFLSSTGTAHWEFVSLYCGLSVTLLPLPVCHAIADILFVLTLNYCYLPLCQCCVFAQCIVCWSAVAAIHQPWPPWCSSATWLQWHCRASSISLLYLPVPIRKCQYWLNTHSSQHTVDTHRGTYTHTHILSTVCLVRIRLCLSCKLFKCLSQLHSIQLVMRMTECSFGCCCCTATATATEWWWERKENSLSIISSSTRSYLLHKRTKPPNLFPLPSG